MIFRLNCVFKNFFLQYFLSNYNLSWAWAMFLDCISKSIFIGYSETTGTSRDWTSRTWRTGTCTTRSTTTSRASPPAAFRGQVTTNIVEKGERNQLQVLLFTREVKNYFQNTSIAIFLTLFCKLILLKNFTSEEVRSFAECVLIILIWVWVASED